MVAHHNHPDHGKGLAAVAGQARLAATEPEPDHPEAK
jgi:hypothetical protein